MYDSRFKVNGSKVHGSKFTVFYHLLVLMWFPFPLSMGAWDGLRYFIVALPGSSML